MLTAAGAHGGVLKGLPCLLGVSTGMGIMLFLVPLGMGSLVLGHPLLLRALNWGGQPVGYLGATIFQWVNPKSWIVSASAAGTFLSAGAGSPFLQAGALGGLFVLAALPSGFLWLAFGAAVQRVLHEPRRLRIFNFVMGALLALSIGLILR